MIPKLGYRSYLCKQTRTLCYMLYYNYHLQTVQRPQCFHSSNLLKGWDNSVRLHKDTRGFSWWLINHQDISSGIPPHHFPHARCSMSDANHSKEFHIRYSLQISQPPIQAPSNLHQRSTSLKLPRKHDKSNHEPLMVVHVMHPSLPQVWDPSINIMSITSSSWNYHRISTRVQRSGVKKSTQ